MLFHICRSKLFLYNFYLVEQCSHKILFLRQFWFRGNSSLSVQLPIVEYQSSIFLLCELNNTRALLFLVVVVFLAVVLGMSEPLVSEIWSLVKTLKMMLVLVYIVLQLLIYCIFSTTMPIATKPGVAVTHIEWFPLISCMILWPYCPSGSPD